MKRTLSFDKQQANESNEQFLKRVNKVLNTFRKDGIDLNKMSIVVEGEEDPLESLVNVVKFKPKEQDNTDKLEMK